MIRRVLSCSQLVYESCILPSDDGGSQQRRRETHETLSTFQAAVRRTKSHGASTSGLSSENRSSSAELVVEYANAPFSVRALGMVRIASMKGWVATGAEVVEVVGEGDLPMERERRDELIFEKIPRGLLG